MVHLITLLDFSPVDFKRFLTVLVDRRLFGNHCFFRTWVIANDIRLTKWCSALSSRSDVAWCLPYLVKSFTVLVWFFPHKPANYCIMIVHLTFNSFEAVDRMSIICHLCASDIRLRTMFTEKKYNFQNTGLKHPDLKRGHTEFSIKYGRHGSRAW